MADPLRVMISCGEASGDLYAAALAAALRRRVPSIEITGLGGPRLRDAGADLVADFSRISVTGLTAPLRVLPRAWLLLRQLVAAARARRPDVFVAVDFSGFNFRVMAALRRLGIPVVYYISPQLWAWRTGRIDTMKRHAERVLVIFPFEEEVYRRAGVPVTFVGHPLIDLARPVSSRAAFLGSHGLHPGAPTVALLPGSRREELRRIGPDMAAALPLIRARVPGVQFVVARAPRLSDDAYLPFTARPDDAARRAGPSGPAGADAAGRAGPSGPAGADAARRAALSGPADQTAPVIVTGQTDDVIAAADVVITASGTATVQCAQHERPMVVVYRVSPIEYRLARRFVKVDMYAMPNLIAGRRIVPELIQEELTPARVADETVALLTEPARHAAMREDLRRVRERLGEPGASDRAAAAILDAIGWRQG